MYTTYSVQRVVHCVSDTTYNDLDESLFVYITAIMVNSRGKPRVKKGIKETTVRTIQENLITTENIENAMNVTTTMKQYEGLSLVEKYTLALKKVSEYDAKIATHRAMANEAMEALKRLEKDSKKRAREDADQMDQKKSKKQKGSLPTPPLEEKKPRVMSEEEATTYRTDSDKLAACNSKRELLKVCRALNKISRAEQEGLNWSKEEMKTFIKEGTKPAARLSVVLSESEGDVTDDDDDDSDDDEEIKKFRERMDILRSPVSSF